MPIASLATGPVLDNELEERNSKSEIRNPKQFQITKKGNSKPETETSFFEHLIFAF
jgi:hypothetical protein